MDLRAVVVAVLVTGCSFIGARVPDKPRTGEQVECLVALPILDTVLATAAVGIGGVFVVDGVFSGPQSDIERNGFGLLAASVPVLASAVYGYVVYGRCRSIRDASATP